MYGGSGCKLSAPGPKAGIGLAAVSCPALNLQVVAPEGLGGWFFSHLFNQSLCDVPAPMSGMGDLETNQICGPWMLQMVLAKASSLYP